MTRHLHRSTAEPHASFDLVYADDVLLILNKPAGLLSVPGRGEDKQDCLASRVQAVYPEALNVHRLDMSTSGLIIMARGLETQRYFHRLFERREVEKTYVAIVGGQLLPESGEIDLPLINDWPNRPRQKVDHVHGKASLTRYRLMDFNKMANTSRVELKPVTGRSHQLRVHLQAIGHSILGDLLYAPIELQAGASRLLLHAQELRFRHPIDEKELIFHSEPPF